MIGAGPIGLATPEFVKLSGAKTIVLDVDEQRLDFCKRVMGVEHTIKPSPWIRSRRISATRPTAACPMW